MTPDLVPALPYSALLRLVLPQVLVVLTALMVLTTDLTLLRSRTLRTRTGVAATLSATGCVAAIAAIVHAPQTISVLDGMIVLTPLAQHLQIALLALTSLVALIYVGSTFTRHVGEYLSLILLATVATLFLVTTQNLLVLFLALELLSLSLYLLTAFDKSSARSAETALKYFLFGGVSAAFLLFGFSLLYGATNSINLAAIAAQIALAPRGAIDPILILAMAMTVVGLGFKIAAVPFHFWAPDVYQAAPAPSAAFIASSSKVASFFVFYQLLAVGLLPVEGSAAWLHYAAGWAPMLALVAASSMLLGNLAALAQTSVRRLLAYSAVAHAGYMLIALLAHTPESRVALLYYVLTYALTIVGTFAALASLEQATGGDTFAHLAGLSRRAPVPALCLFIFLLSLAGIPPLAGFFAKFYLFSAALAADSGLLWLVILAIAASAISLFYYLKVLKAIYVADPPADALPVRISTARQALLCLLAAAVVLLGCAPAPLLHWLR